MWEFINCNLIDYCSLYDEGFARLGCVGCPLAGHKKMIKDFERWPAYRKAYIRAFEEIIAERKRRGKNCRWQTGEDVMNWWLYGNQGENDKQLEMEWEK